MKSKDIITALNDIDPELIEDAQGQHKPSRKVVFLGWSAVVAAFFLAITCILSYISLTSSPPILATTPYPSAPTFGTSTSLPTTSTLTPTIVLPTSSTAIPLPTVTTPTITTLAPTIPTPTIPTPTIPETTTPDTVPTQPTNPPPISPALYWITAHSCAELLTKMADLPNPMGSKKMLQTILANPHLDSLQSEIHWTKYVKLLAEPVKPIDAGEEITLIFHPQDACQGIYDTSCTSNGEASKIRVSIKYRPVAFDPKEYGFSDDEIVQVNPLIYQQNRAFYYFSDYYVCVLFVDYLQGDILDQFQAYCLSIIEAANS